MKIKGGLTLSRKWFVERLYFEIRRIKSFIERLVHYWCERVVVIERTGTLLLGWSIIRESSNPVSQFLCSIESFYFNWCAWKIKQRISSWTWSYSLTKNRGMVTVGITRIVQLPHYSWRKNKQDNGKKLSVWPCVQCPQELSGQWRKLAWHLMGDMHYFYLGNYGWRSYQPFISRRKGDKYIDESCNSNWKLKPHSLGSLQYIRKMIVNKYNVSP